MAHVGLFVMSHVYHYPTMKGFPIMPQALHNLLTFIALHQPTNFCSFALLAVIVCPGWLTAGCLQLASVSTSPTQGPRRTVFVTRDNAILLLLGKIESWIDTIALTRAIIIT